MSTNPDNAVGTNAAYGGRTSVNAFNDDLAVYSRGIMSGWACAPSSGLTVTLGGDSSVRDVAVAEDNAGNKVTINNISGTAIETTINAAPASNSRIDAIVAYVDNPPQGSATITDNYEACGLITVSGTASSTPVEPSDGAIRSAITADGASGTTAYYAVLAYVTVASGTTDITATDITAGQIATLNTLTIMTVGLNSAISGAKAGQALPLTKLISSIGSKLISSGNGIEIGAGVSKVLINANVYFTNSGQQRGWAKLFKNGSDALLNSIADTNPNGFGTAPITPIMFDVKAGDTFTIVNNTTGCNIGADLSTYLTIQVIS